MKSFVKAIFTRMHTTANPGEDVVAELHQADTHMTAPARQQDTPPAPAMSSHRHFPAAALSQPGLDPADATQLCILHLDPAVQLAVQRLQYDLCRLVDASALGLIALAVQRSGVPASDLTASAVVASVQALSAEASREIETASMERAAHDVAFKAAFTPIQRLRNAVGNRAAQAKAEARTLRARLTALEQWRPGESTDRSDTLRTLLTAEELAAIGAPDPVADAADLKSRLAALYALVAAGDCFEADECFSTHHLDGLDFGADVEAARTAAEMQPA